MIQGVDVDAAPSSAQAGPSSAHAGRASTSEALAAWSRALGTEHVLADDADRSVYARSTLPQGTSPCAILRPGSVAEVQAAVRIANRFRIPLYPISRGRNWGYGDACAVSDGQVILDLGRLNKIHEVNEQLAYAVVEPGVTQGQLYEHIVAHRLPLWFDATGAGPEASIVGNVVERGFGHTPLGDRFHNSCAYEIVLPTGELLRTGFGHYATSQVTHLFKTGIGPSLDGLFTQSNLGIIVRMTIWLMPRPQCFEGFALKVPHENDIEPFVERLRELRMAGVVRSTVHIANDLRVLSSQQRYPWEQTGGVTPLPEELRKVLRHKRGLGAWNVLGALYGTRETVAAARKVLRRTFKSLARPRFFTERKLAIARRLCKLTRQFEAFDWDGVASAYGLLQGRPMADHLRSTSWRTRQQRDGADPLERGDGLMWFTPVIPMTGQAARDLHELIAPIFLRHRFEPMLTFTIASDRSLCAPCSVCFNRDDASEIARARDCYNALFAAALERGYLPYRSSIQSMHKLEQGSRYFWDAARTIKSSLDPHGILAPGRYLPAHDQA